MPPVIKPPDFADHLRTFERRLKAGWIFIYIIWGFTIVAMVGCAFVALHFLSRFW